MLQQTYGSYVFSCLSISLLTLLEVDCKSWWIYWYELCFLTL